MGADVAALGRTCGLGDLVGPLPESIPVLNYLAFLDAAARALDDPYFGLHVGENMRVLNASGYGMMLLACRSIRETAQCTIRYDCLSHDLGRSELIEDGEKAYFRWHTPWLHLPGGRHAVECTATFIRAVNHWLIGFDIPIDYYAFSYALPEGTSIQEYERILKAPIRPQHPFNEGAIASALLNFPLPLHDGGLLPELARILDARVAVKHRNFSGDPRVLELRNLLRGQMLAGRVGLDHMAAASRISPRTMQRRLAALGVSFTQLIDDVRRETARELVADQTMPLTEVALLLGYADQSAFNHAFRRWFDDTPGNWRSKR